jgi:hypothetical protein
MRNYVRLTLKVGLTFEFTYYQNNAVIEPIIKVRELFALLSWKKGKI